MFETAKRMEMLPFSGIRVMMEKATQMQKNGADVIHMEIGRPDFDTPQVIKDAAYDSIRRGNVFYTSNYGTPELRKAIAEKLKRDNNVDYTPEEILVTIGVGEGTYAAVAAFLNPGDEVLVPDPVWLNYINVPNLLGAKAVTYSLKEKNGYQMDLDEVRAKITSKTRGIVIVTPNNPTGGVLEEDVLKELAEIAKANDLMVIADEIYERLVYDGAKHVSIASLPGMKERTFTMNGMSKAYAMDGWRLGYVAAPEEYITVMNKFHQHNTTCAPNFVQTASIAALTQEGDEVREMVKEYQRRRDYAVQAINAIDGISCLCPKGAFYIFINCKQLGKTSAELSQYFLEQAKIALVPGDVFGPGGEGYLRMSFAASYESIVEGCERLKAAVAQLI